MYQDKKVGVIIAAAGSGTRMGGGISKQFRSIGQLPILTRAVRAFDAHPYIDSILVVTKADSVEFCREKLIAPYGFVRVCGVIAGGAQRQDSVYRGLLALSGKVDLVLVHDGARPFVSAATIAAVVETAAERAAAAVAVPVKDTIKTVSANAGADAGADAGAKTDENTNTGENTNVNAKTNGYFTGTPDRSCLFAVQTPQAFAAPLLLSAMEAAFVDKFYGTDDSVLVERLGKKVYLVMGEPENIKVTTAEDMEIGAAIAGRLDAEDCDMGRSEMDDGTNGNAGCCTVRMGTGFDVHRLTEDRDLILGGVNIPWEKGLLGHSDADVLVHAIMDALLGAAALGDIGRHFPDRDEAYRGISSIELLRRVGLLLREKEYGVGNVDAVVIAQQPKIAPYIPSMREKIAGALKVDVDRISIKGTTTEGLGFCGRGEGIAAQAVAVIFSCVKPGISK